ncbi:MAG: choice-of-anchor B domain-containing protein [Saprospiraceae bacterium]|jgi:choice-of-anchor B domain-containing protein
MKKFLLFFVMGLCFNVLPAQTVSPPLNMTLHAQWDADTLPTAGGREYNDIWGWVDCSGSEYAIMGSAAYVHFFDVTDPDNIVEKGFFAGGQVGTWRDMKTYRDRAYAVSENSTEGLMIFDMSNIQDTIIKSYQSTAFFARAHNIYIDNEEGRLYAVGTNTQNQGVIILDIATDPDNPILLSSVSLPGGGYIHDMNIKNNIGYCSHGYNGFYVWDFTDPQNPVYQANFGTSGYNHSSWPTADGQHIIYAEEVPLGLPLGILDISDAANGNINAVTTFKFPLLAPVHVNNVPHNPFVRGDYAIVSHYHDGIQIFDISDVQNPTQVAYFDSHANDAYSGYSGCWGVYPFLPSGTIIASDINEGLLVLTADSITLAPMPGKLYPDATLTDNTPTPFCSGEAGLLEVPEGAESYQWYKDGELVAENQNFLLLTESGDYYAEVSNGYCSVSTEIATITVSPSPDLSDFGSGTFSICDGTDILIAAPGGFDNYIWLLDDDIIQQGVDVLTITEAGTYNLVATLGSCSTTSEDLVIEIEESPSPTILNTELYFCEGEEYILETEPGNTSYDWFRNNVFLATTVVPSYSVTEEGDYSVVATNAAGCFSESAAITVSVSLVDAVITFDSGILSETIPASTYLWFLDGTAINGATSMDYTPTQNGDYYCEITNADGCIAISNVINVILSGVNGIQAIDYLAIFPNPATDEVMLRLEVSEATDFKIQLIHVDGRILNSLSASVSGSELIPLDLSQLASGVYFIKLQTEDGQEVNKLVKF